MLIDACIMFAWCVLLPVMFCFVVVVVRCCFALCCCLLFCVDCVTGVETGWKHVGAVGGDEECLSLRVVVVLTLMCIVLCLFEIVAVCVCCVLVIVDPCCCCFLF